MRLKDGRDSVEIAEDVMKRHPLNEGKLSAKDIDEIVRMNTFYDQYKKNFPILYGILVEIAASPGWGEGDESLDSERGRAIIDGALYEY